MKTSRPFLTGAALLAAASGITACGVGLIDFGGGGNNNNKGTVIVKGNINEVLPVTTRNIVVFVFSGNDPSGDRCPATSTTTVTTSDSSTTTIGSAGPDVGESAGSGNCACPSAPADPQCTPGKAVVLASGETDFTLDNVESGKLRVVFLLDNAGTDADGQIDPGDPIAVLDDVDCELDNVKGNSTVTLTDVDISFASVPVDECQQGVSDPPASGRARAFNITVAKTPSDS